MLVVRPPEYFPGLPYAALLLAAERFVVADTVQYSRQSFQNRARLRTPDGWQWISVPLKGGQHGRPIHEVEIDPGKRWAGTHRRALAFNYRTTPYFEHAEAALWEVLDRAHARLGPLTGATVGLLHRLLGASCTLEFTSAWPDPPATVDDVCRRLRADRLLTLPEAAERDREAAGAADVLDFEPLPYRQNFAGFEPGLSALDLWFNYGPAAAQMIRERTRLR